MIRYVAVLLWPLAVLVFLCAPAHADIGGSAPSPGGCDYPAIGTFGAAFGEYDYACQMPVEINGSRWTTLFGGGMWQINAGVGVSVLMFNANFSVYSPAGVLRGVSYWACPDLSMSAPPNPPGAWKNQIQPAPCKTIAPEPVLLPDQPAPPPGAPAAPPPPPPIGPPLPPPDPPLMPTVTNPLNPNPDATDNSH